MIKQVLPAVVVAAFLSINVHASDEFVGMNMDNAKRVISDYKTLRRQCSAAQDKARMQCFNQLSGMNDQYQEAKRIIAGEQDPRSEVRFVSINY